MSEFALIDAFVRGLPHAKPPFGPGDDAAVLRAAPQQCITTDALVENVHFTRGHFTLEDIGHKALAVNLSDLAAMGATPTWWLCALGLPKRTTLQHVRALARGMRPLAEQHGLTLIGGNVTKSPVLTVTLTLAGNVKKPMLRTGAKVGDLIYIAGRLGDASKSRSAPAQRRPTPLVAEGQLAARFATACIDVSDGLLQDLGHLCTASKLGADLESEFLPGDHLGRALFGGEDYALVLAVPREKAGALARAWKSPTPLHCVGVFTPKRGIRVDDEPVDAVGYDHFR